LHNNEQVIVLGRERRSNKRDREELGIILVVSKEFMKNNQGGERAETIIMGKGILGRNNLGNWGKECE